MVEKVHVFVNIVLVNAFNKRKYVNIVLVLVNIYVDNRSFGLL